MAILSAVSTASDPELAKKTVSRSPGASAPMREASSNAFGWPIWKVGPKSSSATCFCPASTIFGWQWPALTHHRPAEASITWRPSGVRKYIPSAPTTSRGSFLNCRFAVNGMKKASRSFVSMWASVEEDMGDPFSESAADGGKGPRGAQIWGRRLA